MKSVREAIKEDRLLDFRNEFFESLDINSFYVLLIKRKSTEIIYIIRRRLLWVETVQTT